MRGRDSLFFGVVVFGAWSAACGPSTPSQSHLDFTVHEVDRLTTRMSEGELEEVIEPERAFLLRSTCPKINRAEYRPEKTGVMGVLQLWGTDLEESWGLVAWPDIGPIGRAQAKAEADGSRRYAVGCRDCTLLLGMESEGVPFACLGPGYSIRLENGKLVRSAKKSDT